jgi:hypothetical protein
VPLFKDEVEAEAPCARMVDIQCKKSNFVDFEGCARAYSYGATCVKITKSKLVNSTHRLGQHHYLFFSLRR